MRVSLPDPPPFVPSTRGELLEPEARNASDESSKAPAAAADNRREGIAVDSLDTFHFPCSFPYRQRDTKT